MLRLRLLSRRHIYSVFKELRALRADSRLPECLPANLRFIIRRNSEDAGLDSLRITGVKPSSTTLPRSSAYRIRAQNSTARLYGRWIRLLELRGLKQAGGFLAGTHLPQALIRKPFAYRPPRSFNRVDVEPQTSSAESKTSTVPNLLPSTFVLAIRDITESFR